MIQTSIYPAFVLKGYCVMCISVCTYTWARQDNHFAFSEEYDLAQPALRQLQFVWASVKPTENQNTKMYESQIL